MNIAGVRFGMLSLSQKKVASNKQPIVKIHANAMPTPPANPLEEGLVNKKGRSRR